MKTDNIVLEKSFAFAIRIVNLRKYLCYEFEQKELASFEDIGGKGIKAIYKENTILIGNETLLDDYNISFEKIHSFGTIMYVIVNNSCVGYILLRDTIKENSKKEIGRASCRERV